MITVLVSLFFYGETDSNQNTFGKIWIAVEIFAMTLDTIYVDMWLSLNKALKEKAKKRELAQEREEERRDTIKRRVTLQIKETGPSKEDLLQQELEAFEKLKYKATQKDTQEFGESFITMTVFCQLKENVDKYAITK